MSTHEQHRSAAASPDDALVDALAHLSLVVQLELTEVAAAHDLSLTQLRLLGILVDHTPAMAELATRLHLDRSSVTGLVERAEKRDLVRREKRPGDGRGVQVRITAEGLLLTEHARAALAPRVLALSSTLTARQRSTLVALVSTLLGGA